MPAAGAMSHLPFDTVGKDLASIAAVDAADLNALSKTALPIDQGVLVLVGDQRSILEQLQGLSLPAPQLLDVHGAPVAR